MRGRSLELAAGNGFQLWGRGGPERQIRRFVCQEKPLRAEGVRTTNRHRWSR
jgi:hypothetical protein